jgi:hypothetical protein
LRFPTQLPTHGQWWSKRSINSVKAISQAFIYLLIRQIISQLPTQLSHRLQCEARGGLNILQVKQYLSLICWLFIMISLVRGGGLYVGEFEAFGTSIIGSKN